MDAYAWTNDPCLPSKSVDLAVLNNDLMHLKYDKSGDAWDAIGFIASGRKFGTPSGFTLPIVAGVDSISDKKITRALNSIILEARRAALVCDDVDGGTTALYAAYPVAVSATVHRWVINGDATIASTVGTNALTKTGAVNAADGRVGYAGIGAGGYYTAANATSVPAYASAFTLRVPIDKFVSNGAAQCFYHDGVRKVACNASNSLLVGGVDTSYTLENGKAYSIEVKGAGGTTTGDVVVNGLPVYSGAVVTNATAVAPKIFANTSNTELCYSVIGYVEILSAQTTAQSSGEVAAGLIIPVCWDKSSATYPTISTADKALAYHEWKFDETSGTTVADTAGTLNGTATGTTIVDSELGLGKARKFNGTSDYVSLGSFALSNSFTLISLVKDNGGNTYETIFSNDVTNTSGITWCVKSNAVSLYDSKVGVSYPSVATIHQGSPAFVASVVENGSKISHYVNSKIPEQFAVSLNASFTAAGNLYIGKNVRGEYWTGDIDYVLYIPRAMTQAEISEIYDSLMSTGRRSLKSLLPAGSISLGYAETGSSGVTTVNDSWWGYGRREGAVGGNRIVTQDYKTVVAVSPDKMKWQPPFGTGAKCKIDWRSAENVNGLNDVPAAPFFINSGYYGVYDVQYKNGEIGAYAGSSGIVSVNNAWRTGGYLRPIFTCLEDDAV